MKMQLNYISTFQSNGQFTFSGNTSGDNLADFMLGLVSAYAQGNPKQKIGGTPTSVFMLTTT